MVYPPKIDKTRFLPCFLNLANFSTAKTNHLTNPTNLKNTIIRDLLFSFVGQTEKSTKPRFCLVFLIWWKVWQRFYLPTEPKFQNTFSRTNRCFLRCCNRQNSCFAHESLSWESGPQVVEKFPKSGSLQSLRVFGKRGCVTFFSRILHAPPMFLRFWANHRIPTWPLW